MKRTFLHKLVASTVLVGAVLGATSVAQARPNVSVSIDLPGLTLMPGLIDAHSHVLLHPYSETLWADQVAHEAHALRVARATNHLRKTLEAGFTTIKDVGNSANYADTDLRRAIEMGWFPGPTVLNAPPRDAVIAAPTVKSHWARPRISSRSESCRSICRWPSSIIRSTAAAVCELKVR